MSQSDKNQVPKMVCGCFASISFVVMFLFVFLLSFHFCHCLNELQQLLITALWNSVLSVHMTLVELFRSFRVCAASAWWDLCGGLGSLSLCIAKPVWKQICQALFTWYSVCVCVCLIVGFGWLGLLSFFTFSWASLHDDACKGKR